MVWLWIQVRKAREEDGALSGSKRQPTMAAGYSFHRVTADGRKALIITEGGESIEVIDMEFGVGMVVAIWVKGLWRSSTVAAEKLDQQFPVVLVLRPAMEAFSERARVSGVFISSLEKINWASDHLLLQLKLLNWRHKSNEGGEQGSLVRGIEVVAVTASSGYTDSTSGSRRLRENRSPMLQERKKGRSEIESKQASINKDFIIKQKNLKAAGK